MHIESDHPWDDDRTYDLTRLVPAGGFWNHAYVGSTRPDGQVVLVFQGEADAIGNADEIEVLLPRSMARHLSEDISRNLNLT